MLLNRMGLRIGLAVFALLWNCPTVRAAEMVHTWSQRFGADSNQYAEALAIDGSGNIIVTGYFGGTVDFGGGVLTSAGSFDIFLAKFDAGGTHLWSKNFGDTDFQQSWGVAVDGSGNVVVTGYFRGSVDFGGGALTSAGGNDIFVAKFDADGNHLWSHRFGDASAQDAAGVAVTHSGHVIITGSLEGMVDFGGGALTSAGGRDIYLARFDAGGTHLWSHRFGDTSDQQRGTGVAVDGSGNVVSTGVFWGTVDFGGGEFTPASGFEIYLTKFDAGGNHLWSQAFPGLGDEYAERVVVDESGNIFLTGTFSGNVDLGGGLFTSAGQFDILIAKFDTDGAHIWSHRFGDSGYQWCNDIAVDGLGGAAVAGYFWGGIDFGGQLLTSAGERDIFVARFDAGGAHRWSGRFGDAAGQDARGLAVDKRGNLVVSGAFEGTVNFGGEALTATSSGDIPLARFWRAAPEIRYVRDLPGDQGGMVTLAWDGSGIDTPLEPLITNYSLWRAIDPMLVSERVAGGAWVTPSPVGFDMEAKDGNPVVREQRIENTTYYWEYLTSVDAYYLEGYSAPVATLFDSTSASPDYHYFQVIAHTSDPVTFYISDPDSGYSIDNLSPAAPQGLTGTETTAPDGMRITWLPNTEADLSHYAVYRGTYTGFIPTPANRIAAPQVPMVFDGEWTSESGFRYKVSAIDIHGNESPYSLLVPGIVVGIGDSPLPNFFVQNVPNPFNPSTRITFGVAEAGRVSLEVYDPTGRLLRVLVDGRRQPGVYDEIWDGKDAGGQAVSSGVYFLRLATGGRTVIRKAVLLR